MNWGVYNSAIVAQRVRLMFCEHRTHTCITRSVGFVGFPTKLGQTQFFGHRNRRSSLNAPSMKFSASCVRFSVFQAMRQRDSIIIFASYVQPWAHN